MAARLGTAPRTATRTVPTLETTTQDAAPARRLRGLDGLRGLAVIAVLVFHQDFPWARGGYLGVSLFFTLSGFLIAGLVIDEVERSGRLGLRSFWGRRLRRLAPAALAALVLVCAFAAVAATDGQRIGLRGDLWSSLANVTNWRFVTSGSSYADLFRSPSPVQHYWSLAIEEQFYVVFPLLVAALAALWARTRLTRLRFRWALAAVVLVLMGASLALQLASGSIDRTYYGTDTRAFELLAGVLLACLWRPPVADRRVARVIGLAGAVLLVVMVWWWSTVGFGSSWLYDGGLAAVAIVSVVVIAAATVPGPVRAIGSLTPLVAVGLVSYGLYLYHWPVYLWLDPARTGLTGWSLFAVRIAVTAGLAVASYHLLEMPFRRGAIGRVRAAPIMWAGALALVAVTVPLAVADADRADVLPTESEVRAAVVEDAAQARQAAAEIGAAPPLRAYVVGDSTGSMFAAGLGSYGARTGAVEVRSGTVEACPFADVTTFKFWVFRLVDLPVEPRCAGVLDRWASDLAQFQPDVVLVVAGPSNVAPFRPAESPEGTLMKLTEPAGRAYVAAGMQRASAALHRAAPGATQVWLTSPYIYRVNQDNGTMVDPLGPQVPAYTDAYNAILAEIDGTYPWVVTAPWADRFNAASLAQIDEEAPDGVHVPPPTVDRILDGWFPEILRARDSALASFAAQAAAAGTGRP